MSPTVKRVAAALSALLGLALTVGGVWLAVRVGPSGTARLTATPATNGAVVLTPQVLNRLEADVIVTATPVSGASVWMGVGAPSDVDAILATGPQLRTTGVNTSSFVMDLTGSGSGELPALATADIWRATVTGPGKQSMTLTQERAPESLVITTDKDKLVSVTMTVERKAWFVQAMVAVLVGLALVLGGLLLWRAGRTRSAAQRPRRSRLVPGRNGPTPVPATETAPKAAPDAATETAPVATAAETAPTTAPTTEATS